MTDTARQIDYTEIKQSIDMIKQYVTDSDIAPLISVLEQFNQDSDDKALLLKLRAILNTMGIIKGAVLTYAPYLIVVLSDDAFEEK
jgi:hypothetical protein